jgi:hypothetical protein
LLRRVGELVGVLLCGRRRVLVGVYLEISGWSMGRVECVLHPACCEFMSAAAIHTCGARYRNRVREEVCWRKVEE